MNHDFEPLPLKEILDGKKYIRARRVFREAKLPVDLINRQIYISGRFENDNENSRFFCFSATIVDGVDISALFSDKEFLIVFKICCQSPFTNLINNLCLYIPEDFLDENGFSWHLHLDEDGVEEYNKNSVAPLDDNIDVKVVFV